MKILHNLETASSLDNSFVFLDTNTFIAAIHYEEIFGDLFKQLRERGCTFVTIPSVLFEFTRGTKSIEDFNKRVKFVQDISAIYPIERHFEQMEDFIIVLQRIKGDISYTDFLLSVCLYKFPLKSFLVTENHKDFPLDILDRECIITIDTDKEIRNCGLYKFSPIKFEKAAEKVLQIE